MNKVVGRYPNTTIMATQYSQPDLKSIGVRLNADLITAKSV
jgi:hypothetical protein